MKISQIIEAWKEDCKVDDLNVDLVASQVPLLHAKYMEILSNERSALRGLQIDRREKVRLLREYYLGQASQEDLEALGREPYGLRILKTEVMGYVESDSLISSLDSKISIQEEKVELLLEIMKSINSRNFTLKSIIDWKRLMLGG